MKLPYPPRPCLRLSATLLTASVLFSLLSACQPQPHSAQTQPPAYRLHTGERQAIAVENDWYGDSANSVHYLPQNWSEHESDWFYFTPQGSKLMPYSLFIHLEQAENSQLFRDPFHLSKFRYLPQAASTSNPHALPVGFVKDDQHLGLTCSACHTGQLNYQNRAIRIDGGPAQADFVGLLETLENSIAATLADTGKFQRLARAVMAEDSSFDRRTTVREQLQASLDFIRNYNEVNHTQVPYGFARVDAIGRIYNQVIRLTSSPAHSLEPSAPSSYPFVWDTSRHDYVQWLGLTSNAGAGALGRNLGEVIGVFGHMDLPPTPKRNHPLQSSAKAGNIVAMEQWLWRLQSPAWPTELLPAPDPAKVAAGQQLYERRCQHCHSPIDARDPNRKVQANLYDYKLIGTDASEALNATTYTAPSGKLKGAQLVDGYTFGDRAPVAQMLTYLVEQLLSANRAATAQAIQDASLWGLGINPGERHGKYRAATADNPLAPLQAYKARPLNGIWATAPYFHNGSAPNLYSVLLPEEERPTHFSVGRLEFDPVKVGFVSDGQQPFVFDTRLPGNSNRGHNVGAGLTDEQRWALVEYLKTL